MEFVNKQMPSNRLSLCALGTTLIGWPALGDGYCNVGRRRSWTWIKLVGARGNVPDRTHPVTAELSHTRDRPRRNARSGIATRTDTVDGCSGDRPRSSELGRAWSSSRRNLALALPYARGARVRRDAPRSYPRSSRG